MSKLIFENQTIEPVMIGGQPHLRVSQIVTALELSGPNVVQNIVSRNESIFTDKLTFMAEVDSAGGTQKQRLFTLQGAIAVTLKSTSPKAVPFTLWALQVLEDAILGTGDQLQRMKRALLQANPRFAKVSHLVDLGLSKPKKIASVLGWPAFRVQVLMKEMHELGLIPRPEWMPEPEQGELAVNA